MAQPEGASLRPWMVNSSCTEPSAVPSAFLMKRASRIGPVWVINEGIVLVAPLSCAAVRNCGFCDGLVPPTVGWEWHWKQLYPLKEGPSPTIFVVPVLFGSPLGLAGVSNTERAWNQSPVRFPPPATTFPAPSAPLASPGSCMSSTLVAGNFALGKLMLCVPAGRGPGSTGTVEVCACNTAVENNMA